jgi:hypothetical protein
MAHSNSTASLLLYIIDTVSSEQQQYAISVPYGSTVARAKAAYIRAKKGSKSAKGAIFFNYHGQNLDDTRPLLSYDIKHSDIIHRVAPPPLSSRNERSGGSFMSNSYNYYVHLDREIAKTNRVRSNVAPPSPTRTDWRTRGASIGSSTSNQNNTGWHHLSFDRNDSNSKKEDAETNQRFQLSNSPKITNRTHWEAARENAKNYSTRMNEASRRANFGDIAEDGRKFLARHACLVSGMMYRTIHRLEGRWAGIVSGNNQKEMLSATNFRFVPSSKIFGPHWIEECTVTAPNGVSRRSLHRWIPTTDGLLHVHEDSNEGSEPATRTTVHEMGGDLLISKTYSISDGKIMRLESTTLLDERTATTRARVTQIFGSSPSAITVFNCVENRVDTTANSMVPSGSTYPPDLNL